MKGVISDRLSCSDMLKPVVDRKHAGGLRRVAGASRRGFTLIELIVVIGVIGILAGLLLPVLSQAKERGRAIRCLGNLKQMGVGLSLYVEDHEGYLPPGRQAGVTQWDLCVGSYAGGKNDMLSPEARNALFMCPSERVGNDGIRLNYSANPNVCKEITATAGPARGDHISRPADVVIAADSIQYAPDGSSHAILWGVVGSGGSPIYWNDGNPANSESPIPIGADEDKIFAQADPAGANFRYRHGKKSLLALFVDAHVERLNKGKIVDRNLYTNY